MLPSFAVPVQRYELSASARNFSLSVKYGYNAVSHDKNTLRSLQVIHSIRLEVYFVVYITKGI